MIKDIPYLFIKKKTLFLQKENLYPPFPNVQIISNFVITQKEISPVLIILHKAERIYHEMKNNSVVTLKCRCWMKKSISVEYVYRKDEIFLFIYVVSLFSDKNNMKIQV